MAENTSGENQSKKYIAGLSLAAIGIVYGDIGTSPLYAFRESFHEVHGLHPSAVNVLGVLSLIFWSLLLVISIKYLIFVLQADNDGEGGIMALTALIRPKGKEKSKKLRAILVIAGLFGASLLYGDSMITPAISVLSAIEGLDVATPLFHPYIIPITMGILFVLFIYQSSGTGGLGKVFGPVTTVWFIILAILGFNQIFQNPEVFQALNPWHAIDFFLRNGLKGYLVLGSVFLVVTGGEALYADIGHFGLFPIRITWFGVVLPGLLINYFGQGALLLGNPQAVQNPFFLMAPNWALYPLVIIATMATIIASQAVISGAFSLSRQAVHLGYLPRLKIVQTSSKEVGQVYMPGVNWILMIACLFLVVGFGSSSNLAAAYGVGVSTDMVFTTLLFSVVLYSLWNWSLWKTLLLTTTFLIVDLAFFGSTIIKVPQGGWFPLVVAAIILLLMTTWKKGREILAQRLKSSELPLETFMQDIDAHTAIEEDSIKRVKGTAIYMYSNPMATPPALLHNIKHNRVIHKNVVILSVKTTEDSPYINKENRLEIEDVGKGFYRIIINNGFAQGVNIPKILKKVDIPKLNLSSQLVTYFLGKERILPTEKGHSEMFAWRDRLFGVMMRNAQPATSFFHLPPNRVVEIGAQVKM